MKTSLFRHIGRSVRALSAITITSAAFLAASSSTSAQEPLLPPGQIQAQLADNHPQSSLKITLSGIVGNFHLLNGAYDGWCIDPSAPRANTPVSAISSYAPAALTQLPSTTLQKWQMINYVVNFRSGLAGNIPADKDDIQYVIFKILDSAYSLPSAGVFPNTHALYADVLANGTGFTPGLGQKFVIILYIDGIAAGTPIQDLIIELPVNGIGDYVWKDTNNNGIQEVGELGINGVTVQLLNGPTIRPPFVTTTKPVGYNTQGGVGPNNDGYYQFIWLQPGDYTVKIVLAQPALAGLSPTLTNQPPSDIVDSDGVKEANGDVSALVNVPLPTTIDRTIDFGYYSPVPISLACVQATGQVGQPYSSFLLPSGGLSPYTFSILTGSLPGGLTLNSATGEISGTPTAAGPFPFTAKVVDANSNAAGTATKDCSVIILPKTPVLSCEQIGPGQVGVPYVGKLLASLGTPPYTFSFTGSLPPGITLNPSTGEFGGTPTAPGTFMIQGKVTDSTGGTALTATVNCNVVFTQPNPLTLACPPTAAGNVGSPFSTTLVVSGGTAPFTFSIVSGALPTGLILNTSNGTISGTPTVAGAFNFTVQVKDATGQTALSQCTAGCGDGITDWEFDSPAGAVGSSQTYTENGIAIVARGYTNANAPVNMYSTTGSDFGLGIDSVSSNLIDTNHYIQLDLGGALTGASATMFINKLSSGGRYNVYGSNTAGSIGTLLLSNQTLDGVDFTIPSFGTYRYISVRAAYGSLRLAGVSVKLGNCTIVIAPPIKLECGTCGSNNKIKVGMPFSEKLSVTGGVAPYTFTLEPGSNLPPGLTLNPSTGVISGTATTAGSYTFTIKVTDSLGNSDTATCTIIVYEPPVEIECAACGSAKTYLGTPFSEKLDAKGGKGPYTFSIISGNLPTGLTLNPTTGVISGTPTATGTFTFTTQVKDANGKTDKATCSIIVVKPPINLECGSCDSSTNKGKIGSPYSATLAVSGGSSPYAYSLASGQLPPGLSISGNKITGTPTTAGSFTFTVKVTDKNGLTDTATCTIIVVGSPLNLDCTACATKGRVGNSYSVNLSISGGTAPYTYSVVTGSLPPGLSVSNGKISGTPTKAGSYTFTLKVTDKNGKTDTATCTIIILTSPVNLNCGACDDDYINAGVAYSANLSVSGGTGPYTYSVVGGSLPNGLTVSNGKISGTPTTAGSFTFTIKATDKNGNSDTTTCKIIVVAPPVDLKCGTCGANKAYKGNSYSATLAVSGGSPGYSFNVSSGSLPPGLSLSNSTGKITGTPTSTGTFTFTTKVTDAKGKTDTATCTITVIAPVDLGCGSCGADKARKNKSYSASPAVKGGTGSYSYSLQSGQLPSGLTLNTSTGRISGTPSKSGTFTFTIKATDGGGDSDNATCTIVVVSY